MIRTALADVKCGTGSSLVKTLRPTRQSLQNRLNPGPELEGPIVALHLGVARVAGGMATRLVEVELGSAALCPDLHIDGSCQRDRRGRVVFGVAKVNWRHTGGKGERGIGGVVRPGGHRAHERRHPLRAVL